MRSTRSVAARSYLKWGRAVERPEVGTIVVLRRGPPPSGHVGFYTGEDRDRVKLLGGNQMNRVCELWFPKSDVLGYRLPAEPLRAAA